MKFKSLTVGIALVGAALSVIANSAPAQAANFTYNEDRFGDLSSSLPPTQINGTNTFLPLPNDRLPVDGNPLQIVGEFSANDLNDYAQFVLDGTADRISIVMSSAHVPPGNFVRQLGYEFYQGIVGSGGTLLSSGIFATDGGDGAGPLLDGAVAALLTGGTFTPGAYSFRTFVNNPQIGLANDVDYNFQVEALPIPTPALLPGLIGMGVAAWRKRRGAVTATAE